ncbi:COX15/CtaA family protein [Goodfellowiella coeruleoviolacea]|uniref:Cytochrome c oxidase assembly protein subunit 15 n=1 Tax=Goodfellowiella coeruleoviolacea TaxID=334858 RepID=A0AAE3KJI2_9PSEU|nr:COX15/CtaA family protein [Goodfellowiella coeruleoviolacea]MCP2170256.1 cytochrome c oxidase assembly protein subunit 15 [Goodfellowiella coeruleoviolacea]
MPGSSWLSRLPSPSVRLQRGFAIAALVANSVVSVTGSVVRVTGSGLGCPTWPECVPGSWVPVAHPELSAFHQWVEFGNRLLFGVVGIAGALCFIAALLARPRRRRVLLLSLTMPLGVVVQAVVGGITVLAGLVWWTVALHFLPSMVLIWLAALLVKAVGEGDEPPRPLVPRPLLALRWVFVVVLYAMLVAGTLVTAAGPHGGDADTPRLELPVSSLAQLHADLLFVYLGMLVALGFTLRAVAAHTALRRSYWVLVAVVLAQGALGMVQYLAGVPEVMVVLHVLGATLVVMATTAVWVACRDRGPVPAPTPPAGPAAAQQDVAAERVDSTPISA